MSGSIVLSRRAFAVGIAALPVMGTAAATGDADTAHAVLLQQLAEALLRRSPQEATGAGFDTGSDADLRRQLDDRSVTGRAAQRSAALAARKQLAAFDGAPLGPVARQDHEVACFVFDTLADMLARPGQVDLNLRPSPYVICQMNGGYYWLPGFVGGLKMATPDDVDAWLARMTALAIALDQESERIAHDAALGVVPPDFVIARTIGQIEALRDTPLSDSPMIAPAVRRAVAAGLPDSSAAAAAIFQARIVPALDRQIAALRAIAPRASGHAGVWHQPDGDAWYAAALRANTTADLDPAELHRAGLDQCEAITAEIVTLLDRLGVPGGSLAARLAALDIDPRYRVSDDDAGRARVLAAAREAIAGATARLPAAFHPVPSRPLEVRRLNPALEAGSAGAYYSGGDPGIITLNLRKPSEHALWRLPALMHHEGVPGHHHQATTLRAAGNLSLFRRIVRFSAYTEGWALYAEQVAGEVGVYDADPAGRVGMLQSRLFRAARIVVDTGIHHQRWSLDKAVHWMIDHAGEPHEAALRELVRYSVLPGQACAFKVGADRILAAREATRKAMGSRFSEPDFHALVLRSGPVPMTVLETSVRQWSAA